MFNERQLDSFLREFPDHTLTVSARTVEGKLAITAVITSPEGDVCKVQDLEHLRDVPCKLAEAFRNSLANVDPEGEDVPASRRKAVKEGLPGIASARSPFKADPILDEERKVRLPKERDR